MANYNLDELVFPPIEAEHLIAYIDETTTERGGRIVVAKDATADTITLDKTVGPANWKDEINCIVKNPASGDKLFVTSTLSIKNLQTGEWVSKIGVGEPTEIADAKDKAVETDAFKRAGFKFGIGRELKRTPRAYIPFAELGFESETKDTRPIIMKGKTNMAGEQLYSSKDVLEVLDVEYSGEGYEKSISYLVIRNKLTSKTYSFGNSQKKTVEPTAEVTSKEEATTPPTIVEPIEAVVSEEISEETPAKCEAIAESEQDVMIKPKKPVKTGKKTEKKAEKNNSEAIVDFGIFVNDPKPVSALPPVQVVWIIEKGLGNENVQEACRKRAREDELIGQLFTQKGLDY